MDIINARFKKTCRFWFVPCFMLVLGMGGVSDVKGQNRLNSIDLDEGMERMAEILGSLHYLENLCHDQQEEWYHFMDKLILAENLVPRTRARLILAFNRSYRAFSENYLQCTQSAIAAINLYRGEGKSLADDLVNRYGN